MQAAPQFASRYSDPNSAANSGSLIALVTGGKVNPVGRRGLRHQRQQDRAKDREERRGYATRRDVRREQRRGPDGRRRKGKGPIGYVRRHIKEGVLYLMVVNMPTEEEMKVASAALAKHHSS